MKAQKVFDNWAAGVISTMRPDALPEAASPRGRNSILGFYGGGQAVASKRPGFEILNPSPMSTRPAVIGQYEYTRNAAGVITSTHLLVGDNGALSTLSGTTVAALDATNATPFTAGNNYPQFAVLNNLLFIVNGTDKKKVSNTSVQNFGISRPSAPTVVDSGVAGTPNGTYEVAISYYNSTTGHQSSRSDASSVTVAAKKITVSWAAPSDAQVDYVFIHIRKGTIMSQFFQLIVGVTPAVAANGGFPSATASVSVNVSDAQLTALELLSPDTAENEPPPASLLSVAAHLSRIFVLDASNIYYSKVGKPEAFDPDAYEPVNPNDGQSNVAIGSYFNGLVIWKTDSVFMLNGVDPNTWTVDVVDSKVGLASASSVRFHKGYLYWWSKNGPVRWSGPGSVPELIGQDLIGPSIDRTVINHGLLNQIRCEVDPDTSLVLFAAPESGETRNTIVLPWNARAQTWVSDGWNPFDIASMAVVKDANGKPWVVVGNYAGRVFRFANADVDGAVVAPSGGNPWTLEGTVTAATSTTLTDSLATFDTTDDALKELYVYLIATDGQVQRRRITSNTSTQLTVTPAWDATPDTTYTYAIAAPHWQWDTPWEDQRPALQEEARAEGVLPGPLGLGVSHHPRGCLRGLQRLRAHSDVQLHRIGHGRHLRCQLV
jgi:hypothetical protein